MDIVEKYVQTLEAFAASGSFTRYDIDILQTSLRDLLKPQGVEEQRVEQSILEPLNGLSLSFASTTSADAIVKSIEAQLVTLETNLKLTVPDTAGGGGRRHEDETKIKELKEKLRKVDEGQKTAEEANKKLEQQLKTATDNQQTAKEANNKLTEDLEGIKNK